ncbi:MAG TPA: AvaI/BsoBI family type II restriction endonuclease [Blastocatellia bacterium]|nr:AvaI/BsoBI family type II restriction endonuclease [Blastocatellia bacterium]
MTARRAYLQHLASSDDLITTYEATRAGFVALALEKNRRATPFVAQARALKAAASKAKTPEQLLNIEEIQPALRTAAGISDKAIAHLQSQDKAEAIRGLINNFLEPAGKDFVEELVFRFLLTRGDTLGGSMRNVGGVLAQRKLTRAIIATLTIGAIPYQWLHSANNAWAQMTEDDTDIELYVRGICWQKAGNSRTLIYNLTVPFLKNNVDLCLFNCSPNELAARRLAKSVYNSPASYIALGELKGGIDPAGADEHWKTARTALNRIQKAFSDFGLKPHTFFIGAAIEKKMATEIWSQLEEGTLENAANLTDDNQVASVSRWLCNL